MGLNDFQEVIFPSWAYKNDPDNAALKLVPLAGQVMGEEARIAREWNGYHKAAAGEQAVLGKIVKLNLATDYIPDQEVLNPKGIQCIQKKKTGWVIWGDRIPATSTGLVWKHKRELLSHYERVLMENYDWVIFQINDTELWNPLRLSLKQYFVPEWRPKRAVRGDKFKDAVQIKLDEELNTVATMDAGDLYAMITVRLADTVERFNIIISPAGIFETISLAA
jgi:phage tail sheath protein FI